ncbi:hypothetical protein ACRQ5Q_17890 [Bradyrhizobium sp. PMVTL-01]|uniref:hypothetical protein n=1 Tax=Bradyrhizobium sp. PMVTL-01 TaxID=3434999 RepID=UPI003F6F5622
MHDASRKPRTHGNPPRPLHPSLARLQAQRNWVVWRWESNNKGEWTKVPYVATAPDRKAKNNDPTTWRGYEQACDAVDSGKADGIGFNLLGTHIAAFDIDKCRDAETGELHPFATSLVRRAASYTEITPSGTGLRIIGTASDRYLHRKLKGPTISVEFYRNCERYITISNAPLNGEATELADIDRLLDTVLDEFDQEKRPGTRTPQWDDSVIDEAKLVDLTLIEPLLDDKLLALVRNGVQKEEDRSKHFHHAIGWLKQNRWSVAEIFALLKKYPNGIAKKYVGRTDDRLSKETQRSFTKTREAPKLELEAEPEPEPESTPEPPPPPHVAHYIVMKGGKLVPIAIAAEDALIKSNARIFQRKGHLVRPVRYNEIKSDRQIDAEPKDLTAIHRDRNAVVLQVIDKPHLLLGPMSMATKWYRIVKEKEKYKLVETDPLPKYATEILARVGQWKFPVLRGVIAAPTLDCHGDIIEKPGYHEASGLLLDFKPGDFPPVPTRPTKDDALKELAKLNQPLRGFPFDGEDDKTKISPSRSVLLSTILCAAIRPSLRIVPLHGIDSPSAGTGKTMAAKLAAITAAGMPPVAINQGHTPEEDEKRLSVVLNEGDPVILLDNCERPITGAFLCSMLTEEQVQARILGLSERRLLPNNALVIATGNNLVFAGDVVRRAVVCRLNANTEHPEDRLFDFSATDEVKQQRHELLIAALTILRAYKLAKPDPKLRPMGDFRDYEWIRGALVWLGQSDPAESQTELFAHDPMKDSLASVLKYWDDAFGQRKVTVSELGIEPDYTAVHSKEMTKKERDEASAKAFVLARAKAELRTALIEEASPKGIWASKSVGKWLRRNRDRYVGGLVLKRLGTDDDRTATWVVLGGKGPAEPTTEDIANAVWERRF